MTFVSFLAEFADRAHLRAFIRWQETCRNNQQTVPPARTVAVLGSGESRINGEKYGGI